MENISFTDWLFKNFKKTKLLFLSIIPTIMFFINIIREFQPADLKKTSNLLTGIQKIFIENLHVLQYSLNILLILVASF